MAAELIGDLTADPEATPPEAAESDTAEDEAIEGVVAKDGGWGESTDEQAGAGTSPGTGSGADVNSSAEGGAEKPVVYGDNAYGTGPFHDLLEREGIDDRCKTQQPVNRGGRFAKDAFEVDLQADQVTCPAGQVAPIRRDKDGAGTARFGSMCADCPLREQCTAATGRTISVGAYEQQLTDARARQRDPEWVADYRGTRPKVERKIGHAMRRKHGGRRARVRGRTKVDADFSLLAAAVNLARLGVLAVAYAPGRGWAVTAA